MNNLKEVTELLKSILEEQQLIRKELQDIKGILKLNILGNDKESIPDDPYRINQEHLSKIELSFLVAAKKENPSIDLGKNLEEILQHYLPSSSSKA